LRNQGFFCYHQVIEVNQNVREDIMKILLLTLTFIILGIISPVLLISMAAPSSFALILIAWTIFAVIFYPLGWIALGRRRLV
jgi:1,4-dihydroxy-2-naphthoate octaprenyltransferase